MEQASVMLARLNLETQAYHALADAGWRGLLAPDITEARYVDQLVLAYGFEAPLEAALAYTPDLDLVIDVHVRHRAGYIAQDLIALGMRPGEVARLAQLGLAPFAGPLEALGWMYVAARATPLHEEVRRCIAVRIPDARHACAYLSADDGCVGARWHSLGQALDRMTRASRRQSDEVIAAAHAGFRAWLEWSRRKPLQRAC